MILLIMVKNPLTSKQESFAQAIVTGMNQSDAYRAAYAVSATTKLETVNKRSSELMSNGEVSGRVKALQAELANKSLWTREQSVAVLSGVVDDRDAKHSDRISAVTVLNRMQGFDAPEKHIIEGTIVHRIELIPLA